MALLLPKLRSNFAEFLNNSLLAHLRILSLTTCVRSRYGPNILKLAAFLENWHRCFTTWVAPFAPSRLSLLPDGFANLTGPSLCPQSNKRDHLAFSVTTSHIFGCRDIDLLSIGYAFRPRLRSRLTLGGRTFPRKP